MTTVHAALFMRGKHCKQFRGSSTGKWINELWCSHHKTYFTIKRNELLKQKSMDESQKCYAV